MAQKLTRLEALVAAMDGKKIRSADWDSYCYIYLNKGVFFGNLEVEAEPSCTPLYEKIKDWELYEEPEQNEKFVGYEHRFIDERGHFCCAKDDRNWEVVSKAKPYWQHLETIEHHYEKINGKWEKAK